MKKLISIMMVLVVFLLGFTVYATDDDDLTPRYPKLSIEELAKIPTVNAGDVLSFNIKVMNTSNHTASQVTITPSFEGTPLVYERPIIVSLEKSIRARKDIEVNFAFKVNETAKVGVYAIPFKLQYNNIYDQVFTNEQKVYFKVIKENSPSLITVNNIKTSIDTITPKSDFLLSFDINNIGELPAKNMKVILKDLNKDEFIALDSDDLKYIGTVLGKESVNVSFSLSASKEITDGTHVLSAEISYDNVDGENISVSKNLYLTNVSSTNKEDENDTESGTPKIMISSYKINPSSIKAGDSFSFSFTFTNTNNSKSIKNIKITVDSTDGSFMIAKGSNTFYVEKMSPKSSITKNIDLDVKRDLTSKSYPVNITFDYEDSKGTNYNSTEIISIPVTEYSKLTINSVNVGEAYVDGNTSLSFDYINMGKATILNLTASVEGDYKSVQPINYIGNLNAGNADYYDIEVVPTKEGSNYGTLILAFEDSSGKIIEVKKEFEGFAMLQQSMDDFEGSYGGDDIVLPDNDSDTFHISTWAIIGIGVGTFIVSFIVTKFITTRILRKKLEDEI